MRLRVARLLKAHGLKGGIKLELYTDDPNRRFVPGATFALQVPEGSPWSGKTLTVAELRWYNGHPVGFFREISDRTAAETAIKAILVVEQEQAQLPDEPNAWYDHQLVGLAAFRGGERVGTVTAVEHLPAQDLLVVNTSVMDAEAAIAADGRPSADPADEVLIPFVSSFVPEVDIAAGRVRLTPPLGLFERVEDDAAGGGESSRESGSPGED